MSFGLGRAVVQTTSSMDELHDASTPWMAAADGNLPLLQQALSASTALSANSADENGYTLLQAAASYGRIGVMEWLMPQLHSLEAADADGDTALHHATTVPACQLLLQHCPALLHKTNHAQQTALQVKQEELKETMSDEDADEDDEDLIQLKAVVQYLESLARPAQ